MIPLDNVCPPRSAYLHIPFCHRRCFYCDFAVVPLGDRASGEKGPGSASIKDYLKVLHKEISLSPKGPKLATVYIGGGTPSLLSSDQISSLLQHLRVRFGFQDGSECTLEMDPRTFNKQDLEDVIRAGINRVSLGGQSFDDEMLESLGRSHRRQHLIEASQWLDRAHKKGDLSSWSLDLIQNLPGQELATWEDQLAQAIATFVPHISVYDLSIEPGTVFNWLKQRGKIQLPDEDLAVEIMRTTSETLRESGFSRYEISSYALPGHSSRHNRVYWSGSGWWAFGQGATSAPWGHRLARPRTRNGYRSWVEKQDLEGLDSSLLEQNAAPIHFEDQVILGFRCREGIDLEALAKRWGWSPEQCETHLPSLLSRWSNAFDHGWIKCQGGRFQLTDPEGMMISNQVLVEFLLWWEALPDDVVVGPSLAGP